MRYLMITVICFAGTFFLTSCKEKPAPATTVEDFSVKKVTGDLTDSEIKTLLSALGLSCERFSIMIPERCGLTFTTERYENGTLVDGSGKYTKYLDKGLESFMLCKKQEGSEYKFSIHNSSSSSSFSSGDLKGRGATTWSLIQIPKLTTEKQPIYYFAANTNGIEGYGYNAANFDVDHFTKKYEFAMIIYASVKEKE